MSLRLILNDGFFFANFAPSMRSLRLLRFLCVTAFISFIDLELNRERAEGFLLLHWFYNLNKSMVPNEIPQFAVARSE